MAKVMSDLTERARLRRYLALHYRVLCARYAAAPRDEPSTRSLPESTHTLLGHLYRVALFKRLTSDIDALLAVS